MTDAYYDDFDPKQLPKQKLKKQIIYKLYKRVKKDKGKNMPHYRVEDPGIVASADLLFLPHDNGYKYALVVVDNATRKVDAEPLKNKTAEAVLKAFVKIFNRGKFRNQAQKWRLMMVVNSRVLLNSSSKMVGCS